MPPVFNAPSPLIPAPSVLDAQARNRALLAAAPVPALSSAPVFSSSAATFTPPTLPNVGVSQRLTDQDELHRLQSTGSGVSQIKNPFLRGVARVGDIASAFIAPRISQLLPGTTLHHAQDIARQQGVVQQDTAQETAAAQERDLEAQADQRRSLATQEQAKAEALLHPQAKPSSGKILTAQDGSAAGYQHDDGTIVPLDDPSVPDGVRKVAGNFAGKPVKTPLAEQPLTDDEAKRLNTLWDGLAEKHHLPKGQFVAGMSHADSTALASGLNNVVGKQQGDTRVNVTIAGQQERNAQQNNTSFDPAVVQSVASGAVKLNEVFGRGASTAQKAAFVAAVRAVNPQYNSGDHDIENHLRNSYIAGKQGQALTAFSTAQTHLEILRQASDALHNGDLTAFNALSQQYAKATGSSAPTDFNAVKNAVKGEVARALTGNVTVSEQAELDKDFNNASSPRQIAGVAKKYMQLIDGKKQAMRETYEAGQKGQVNFGASGPQEGDTKTNSHGDKIKFSGGKWGPA